MKPLVIFGILLVLGLSSCVGFLMVLGAGVDEHHVSIREWATAQILKNDIVSSEIQFHDQHHIDETHTGIGEYAFLSVLSGLVPFEGQKFDLLDSNFRSAQPQESGYRFVVYLPDGPHAGVADPYPQARHFSSSAAALREQFFVAYAWPVDPNQGHRILAIDQNLNVYVRPMTELPSPPFWYALYGSADWGIPPAAGWEPYHR